MAYPELFKLLTCNVRSTLRSGTDHSPPPPRPRKGRREYTSILWISVPPSSPHRVRRSGGGSFWRFFAVFWRLDKYSLEFRAGTFAIHCRHTAQTFPTRKKLFRIETVERESCISSWIRRKNVSSLQSPRAALNYYYNYCGYICSNNYRT